MGALSSSSILKPGVGGESGEGGVGAVCSGLEEPSIAFLLHDE